MFNITCVCGHSAAFDEFTQTRIGGPLPNGQYQCPACQRAWRVERDGQTQVMANGFVIPAKRKIVGAQAQL